MDVRVRLRVRARVGHGEAARHPAVPSMENMECPTEEDTEVTIDRSHQIKPKTIGECHFYYVSGKKSSNNTNALC